MEFREIFAKKLCCGSARSLWCELSARRFKGCQHTYTHRVDYTSCDERASSEKRATAARSEPRQRAAIKRASPRSRATAPRPNVTAVHGRTYLRLPVLIHCKFGNKIGHAIPRPPGQTPFIFTEVQHYLLTQMARKKRKRVAYCLS